MFLAKPATMVWNLMTSAVIQLLISGSLPLVEWQWLRPSCLVHDRLEHKLMAAKVARTETLCAQSTQGQRDKNYD